MDNNTAQASSQNSSGPDGISSNKYLWAIGAVILLVVGFFGVKTVISPADDYRVSLVNAPPEGMSGGNVTFTWRVDGPPTTISSTTIYMGTQSNPGDLKKDVKPADTTYTEYVKDFANGKYDVPLQFVGNHLLSSTGKVYYRVYALIKDKHYWSEEYSMDAMKVDNSVVIANIPDTVTANQVTTFTWRVDGPSATINHTSIHYGLESNPGKLGFEVSPADTKYSDMVKDFANGKYDVPLVFVGNTTIKTPGTYYFRGHAVINGKNYWTDEGTFTVVRSASVTGTESESAATPTASM